MPIAPLIQPSLGFSQRLLRAASEKNGRSVAVAKRWLLCGANASHLADRCKRLENSLAAANWADSVALVMNLPFWEAEICNIEQAAHRSGNRSECHAALEEIRKTMNCLYEVEDTRDHINEMSVYLDHVAGLGGLGIHQAEPLDDVDDQIAHLNKQYESLSKRYNKDHLLTKKIDETVGQGIAFLRQRMKFDFPALHKFFY